MLWSIDVSGYDSRRYVFPTGYKYDLPIDWTKARDQGGLSLAIIKASEGTGFTDGAFRMNWTGARGILPRAAYHFFRSNQNAIAQANKFISLLAVDFDKSVDYAVMDFETPDGMTGQKCLNAAGSFLYELEKWGVKPILYTYPGFWNSIGGASATWAAKYPLWLAQWPMDNWAGVIQVPPYLFTAKLLADLKYKVSNGILKPMALRPWTGNPAIWQFTARADAQAIPGHPALKRAVDYNAVYMPLSGVVTPPPPPPPPPDTDTDYKVNTGAINVRAGPTTAWKIVRVAYRGELLHVQNMAPVNGYVQLTDGTWVYLAYLIKVQ
jgi:hypothetical protein